MDYPVDAESFEVDGGTIFNKLLLSIRKNKLQHLKAKHFADRLEIAHSYLNKLETGAIRTPKNIELVERMRDVCNSESKDQWGDLLLHVYKVVHNDRLNDGEEWNPYQEVVAIVSKFNYVKCCFFPNSTVRSDFLDSLGTKSEAGSKKVLFFEESLSKQAADVNYGLSVRIHRGKTMLAQGTNMNLSSGFSSDIAEFVLFGRSLLIVNFAGWPRYITNRTVILDFSKKFHDLFNEAKFIRNLIR